MRVWMIVLVAALAPTSWALGQSSSLFRAAVVREVSEQAATTQPASNGAVQVSVGATIAPNPNRNVQLARFSLTAVAPPEPTIIRVHDLVGIIVRHRYRSQTDARLEQESEWDVFARLNSWFRIHDSKWNQQNFTGGNPELDFRTSNELENEGRSDRRDLLETRVMGKVIDVKPNGNLIIVATYSIENDEDVQWLSVTGEINSRDIAADRTVTSDKIYGVSIKTSQDGAVADAKKRGWFKELVDNVKPF